MSDFDELLNLEEEFYREGYQEGHNENLKNNFLEGKQFGLQVGYQRFVLLGQMVGICDVFDSLELENVSFSKNIETVLRLIESVERNNEEENVEEFEKTIVKLKNKFRTIMILFQRIIKKNEKVKKDPLTFEIVEDLARIIAGEIKGFVEDEGVSEAKNTQDQAQAW